mmetsp:Transcript_46513/g.92836  ORF Transcript_46513/g.92836 Transcript_46513/m.92836 type:complete len:168 (-) Transcript_46513:143-646(-)
MPLTASVQLELARQLEMLAGTVLGSPRLLPHFMEALTNLVHLSSVDHPTERSHSQKDKPRLIVQSLHPQSDHQGPRPVTRSAHQESWAAVLEARPDSVEPATWQGLLEFVIWKLILLLGVPRTIGLIDDLCDADRFHCLAAKAPRSHGPALPHAVHSEGFGTYARTR